MCNCCRLRQTQSLSTGSIIYDFVYNLFCSFVRGATICKYSEANTVQLYFYKI